MADDLLIQPLPLDPIEFPPLPLDPGFTELMNDELGILATAADGFDAMVAELITLVDSYEAGLVELGGADGGELDDTFEEILTIDPTDAAQHVVDLAAAIPDMQSNVDALGDLIVATGTPAPPTGGGTAKGTELTAVVYINWTQKSVFGPQRKIGFTVHVTGLTGIAGESLPGGLSATWDLGTVTAGGAGAQSYAQFANNTEGDIVVTAITIGSDRVSYWQLRAPATPLTLKAGSWMGFTVIFTPPAAS